MKTLKHILNRVAGFMYMVFLYIFLMIDRLILVPFPMYESKSVFTLANPNDDKLVYSLIRVFSALIISAILILVKLIF